MATFHEEAARSALRNRLKDPESTAALVHVEQLLQDGGFDPWIVQSIGQDHFQDPARWNLEQVLMFAQLAQDIVLGKVGTVDIGLWDSPFGDHRRERNQKALDELPAPFTAHVDPTQYGADNDGWLEWSEPIRVCVTSGKAAPDRRGDPQQAFKTVMVGPMRLPLEIGYTKPSRTLLHIREGVGVARWPYGFEQIRLFLNMQHVLPSAVWSRDVASSGCSCHEISRRALAAAPC